MKRPNILLIHSHDTGRCIQPSGHAVATPALQQLAAGGVSFRKAFCVAPMCSPARAGLFTGQYPHSCGMTGLAHRGFALNDPRRHLCFTLKEAGYCTALAGVQHLAADAATLGYDHLAALGKPAPGHAPGTVLDAPDAFEVVAAAQNYLQSPPGQPFFLSIGFFETHRPFPPPDAALLNCLPLQPVPDCAEARKDMAGFLTSVQVLDESIGAILGTLEEVGLAEDSLVIYTSDHGPPFPGMKCTLGDTGPGVALLMRGPGGFCGGRSFDTMVSHLDLYPTLCELLEIPSPGWLQGRSLLPLLQGERASLHDELYAEINCHGAWEPQRSVRTERWKYIRRFGSRKAPVICNVEDGPAKDVWLRAGWPSLYLAGERLHDLWQDPGEGTNLVSDLRFAPLLSDMRQRLERWMKETDDPLLHGRIPAPAGALMNDPDSVSPGEALVQAQDREYWHA